MLNFGNKEFRNLQEQVLKNAQDIETLKGRENLQIVIVEELPEEGNPNYIYLVPNNDEEESNVYDEYIWLADSEEYEKIGGVNIDLSNYVTTDTEQTISGKKTFTADIKSNFNIVFPQWTIKDLGDGDLAFVFNNSNKFYIRNGYVLAQTTRPISPNAYDLGTSSVKWKDLYLSGQINVYDTAATPHQWNLKTLNNYYFGLACNGTLYAYINPNGTLFTRNINPDGNNTRMLGSSSTIWNITYTTDISDGVNTVAVANIASKATSTFISGTFDSNGESTIDTENAGTPEGLFIFTYGNCQCFLRLTATMVQNADTTPIRVACPMIYNSNTVNGWLNITKSGYILILKITDGTNHVDSGYAWTLTKTNLI